MVRLVFFALFICLSAIPNYAQTQKVSSKKLELEELRKEISSLEQELRQTNVKEKRTFELVDKYNKQTFLLNKLINSLKNEEAEKETQIEGIQTQVSNLKSQLDFLQKNYALYVLAVYKKMYNNKLEYFINSESMVQALLRYRYLKTFSERGKKDVQRINETKTVLLATQDQLADEKQQKIQIIAQKSNEESYLTKQLKEKKTLLKQIKNDKTSLQKDLENKKKAEQRIKQLISRLIENEIKAKKQKTVEHITKKNERNTEEKPTSRPVATSSSSIPGNFPSLRGKILWPVSNGSILHKFGESQNAKLKTVTINYGIDIKTIGDAAVRSVAEGEVSVINWIPGYGTVIILTHSHQFRTVYGHLASVNVQEGQKIKPGTVLGSISETFEGNVLHFEIWNERQSQNPESWLTRR